MPETVMQIKNLTKSFNTGFFVKNIHTAVNDVNLDIKSGRFISLIGESGSGKTTVGKLILRLLKPTSGSIIFEGNDIAGYNSKELKNYYRHVQGIFQDPFSSFNPLYKIDRVFKMIFENFYPEEKNRTAKIEEAVRNVGMNPKEILGKYPHQLSGGQLQRLLIARALLMKVKVLIADELISMLDASTRIDILNLLSDIVNKTGMTVIFITHDLSLGYYVSEETLIMHKGRIVESGNTVKIFKNPVHPYTKMLMEAVPDVSVRWDRNVKFLPETVDNELQRYYSENMNKAKGLIEIEEGHQVMMKI